MPITFIVILVKPVIESYINQCNVWVNINNTIQFFIYLFICLLGKLMATYKISTSKKAKSKQRQKQNKPIKIQ
jgi:membrane-bound ClpP family serine protease